MVLSVDCVISYLRKEFKVLFVILANAAMFDEICEVLVVNQLCPEVSRLSGLSVCFLFATNIMLVSFSSHHTRKLDLLVRVDY